ncbi:hypothetical protein [Photobacterium leiognathi]|uniref:hypothetical protein n=1 Tax=Photobacterium leiognathi TaxID=553611 RepID=UPI002981D0CF|nr:hypothetical protein [Photobacterium leiognathi]
MNLMYSMFLSLLIFFSSVSYSAARIDSKDAPFHEGERVTACGILKEVSRFKRGLYLNMDQRFPKQSLTLIIWEDDLAEFKQEHGSIFKLVDHEVCGKGKVTEHRGRSQISLYNAYSLKVIKQN